MDMKRADALTSIAAWSLQQSTVDVKLHRRPVTVNVTIDLPTLLGLAENPGQLAGYGAIPASVARALASDGKWQRFITDPQTGTLLDFGRESYEPPQALIDFLIARDRTCRFPGCRQSAARADLDHAKSWESGGETSAANLGALCRRHHRLKTHGGWNSAAANFDDKAYAGKGLGVPYGVNGNLINRRLDLLKEAGAKTTAPKTWEELMEAATKTMKVGGAGFALGNVGDAESVFRAQFVGYGGRYADAAGKKCTIDAPATKDFLAFVKKWYDKGAYATSAVTTDGGWDNNLYLGGKTVFIANPGSVYTTLLNGSAAWPKNPTLAKNTGFSALPGGPKARVAPSDAWLRAIPSTTKYPELAQDLIRYLMKPENIDIYYEWAIYGPSLKAYNKFEYWDENVDPVHGGLYDLATNGTSSSFPDVNNAAYAQFGTEFQLSKMVQRHLLDKDSADKTIAEAQAACQKIYDANNK